MPAAGLNVPPDLPRAAALALGQQSRSLSVSGTAERWPACVIVALAHVAAAAGARSVWHGWHRAAGLRASKRSAGEWGGAFMAALRALELPATAPTAAEAVLAHTITSGAEGQGEAAEEAAEDSATAGLRLDPFGGGVLRADAASGQARAALPDEVTGEVTGGLPLAFDADGVLADRELPAEAVWVLYPATAELRSDIAPRVLVTSTLPLAWRGWRLVQLDLKGASWIALHDGERRVVRGRGRPVLRTGMPVPGVTTVAGEPVFAGPPEVLLPPGEGSWRIEARRAGTGSVVASAVTTGDAWRPDALWRDVPRPLLGALAITVIPGLRRTVVLAEGLGVSCHPSPRLTSPNGLEPAEAVISAPPGMTASPSALTYQERARTREITCVAGPVVQRLAVTPPHIRLRVDPEPGSGGVATAWHHDGPLRLTSDDLWRGGVLRIDLPAAAEPPPVTILARSGSQAPAEPVQVLAPAGDGRYPLRRILDTVTVRGRVELVIAVTGVPVTIATVSGTGPANDPWAMT